MEQILTTIENHAGTCLAIAFVFYILSDHLITLLRRK